MAYYKAIANGNADTLAIWNVWNGAAWVAAGSLPTTTDDVYTNNYIVTVTTSQSYKSWNRSSVAAPLSITQGGQFQIDGANEITTQGTVNGSNVTQAAWLISNACVGRLVTHINTYTHIGNSYGGSSTYCSGIWNNSKSNLFLMGNLYGGSGAGCSGLVNSAVCNVNLVGDQTGGSSQYSAGFNTNTNSVITVVGNQYGGAGAIGTFNSGIRLVVAAATLIVTGNQIASNNLGIISEIDGSTIIVTGNAYSSSVMSAIGTSTMQVNTTIIFTGNLYNTLSVMAIFGIKLFLNVTPTTVWEFSDFDGDTQYLYGAGVNTGHPIEADVREDTVYGPNDEFEGTCAVPPKASVVKNVPVDNTVGTWAFDDTLIERLEKVSTVDITQQQLTAFLNS